MAPNSSTTAQDGQYGGNNRSGWLKHLPDSWLPFVQLARLSPPAGVCLVYFPHLFGILHAAILTQSPAPNLLYTSALVLGATFFVSNALHIWDDLIDAPLDALVERTRNRPIPRGAVTTFAVLIFTATQAVGAALFLPYLPGGFVESTLYAIPGIVGWAYYPWAKRHTYYPQLVLGFCLSWGIVMGSLAGGFAPIVIDESFNVHVEPSSLCLFGASTLWTMIYDTIYAHQDLEDDKKAGIKSLAVLYEGRTKTLFCQLLAVMTALLIACGQYSQVSFVYYLVAVLGSVTSLGLMIWKVDLKDDQSCWWWFRNGFWCAGGSIAGGLLLELLLYTPSRFINTPLGSNETLISI